MAAETNGEKPVSIRNRFLSNSRNLMVSFTAVALSTVIKTKEANAIDVESPIKPEEIAQIVPSPPVVPYVQPEITNKVYLDIKIANYTEESTGTNRGADGSGRVVFGLFGKIAPDSVQRVSCYKCCDVQSIGLILWLIL